MFHLGHTSPDEGDSVDVRDPKWYDETKFTCAYLQMILDLVERIDKFNLRQLMIDFLDESSTKRFLEHVTKKYKQKYSGVKNQINLPLFKS